MTQKQDYVAIGVDVASKKLDTYILPKNKHQVFENNRKRGVQRTGSMGKEKSRRHRSL